MFELIDDGTLDTVLRCSACGQEERFNYDDAGPDARGVNDDAELTNEQQYDAFVAWAIETANDDHACETDEDDSPAEDDLTTSDHVNFYQSGKLVLTSHTPIAGTWAIREGGTLRHFGTFKTCELAVRAYMDRAQYWPNCWFISDHGNAHRMDLN